MSHAAEQMHDSIGWLQMYRLRMKRRRLLWRSFRSRHQLNSLSDRTRLIAKGDILSFTTLRNELERLPWFFRHYRSLGVDHFLMVDNGSDDGTVAYLLEQPDVSLWRTDASYRGSRFGLDWLTWLQMRYGHDHWTLMVDADELLIYAHHDTRSLKDLTAWLQNRGHNAFGALMLDMYPKGALDETAYLEGQDPFEIARWFDAGNYQISRNPDYGNLWIQGGPRARVFFRHAPEQAPALNKIPLVKWDRRYVHVSSTHMLLPRGLNTVFDEWGGEKASGCLLHAKFLDMFPEKSAEEVARKEHYSGAREYRAYEEHLAGGRSLWCQFSEKYINWRQLEVLGLMSKGNWA